MRSLYRLSLVLILLFYACNSSVKEGNANDSVKTDKIASKENSGSSNAMKASTSTVFIGEKEGDYRVYVTPDKHPISVGDELDGVKSSGQRVTVKIYQATIGGKETEVIPVGTEGTIYFNVVKGSLDDLGGDFYWVDKGAPYPTASEPQNTQTADQTPNGVISAIFNDLKWNASTVYMGALFYQGGNKMMDPSGKPYLQLAFKSNQAPDNRQLTIAVKNFSAKTGTIPMENIEVLLSGSAEGKSNAPDMVGYKPNDEIYKGYSFKLTITKWEETGNGKAKMDAVFEGKLKGIFGSKDVVVKDGKIQNVEVTVYKEKY